MFGSFHSLSHTGKSRNKFLPFQTSGTQLFFSHTQKSWNISNLLHTHTHTRKNLEHPLFITKWGKDVNENDVHDLFSSECNEKWQTVLSANNIKNDSRQPNRIYSNSQTQNKDVKPWLLFQDTRRHWKLEINANRLVWLCFLVQFTQSPNSTSLYISISIYCHLERKQIGVISLYKTKTKCPPTCSYQKPEAKSTSYIYLHW